MLKYIRIFKLFLHSNTLTNDYPKLFVQSNLTRTNARIYLYRKIDTNGCLNKYWWQIYWNIRIYLSHSGPDVFRRSSTMQKSAHKKRGSIGPKFCMANDRCQLTIGKWQVKSRLLSCPPCPGMLGIPCQHRHKAQDRLPLDFLKNHFFLKYLPKSACIHFYQYRPGMLGIPWAKERLRS